MISAAARATLEWLAASRDWQPRPSRLPSMLERLGYIDVVYVDGVGKTLIRITENGWKRMFDDPWPGFPDEGKVA